MRFVVLFSGIPLDLQGTFFNRYGFETEPAGLVEVKINVIHQRVVLTSSISKSALTGGTRR